jgi:hypothetical protein
MTSTGAARRPLATAALLGLLAALLSLVAPAVAGPGPGDRAPVAVVAHATAPAPSTGPAAAPDALPALAGPALVLVGPALLLVALVAARPGRLPPGPPARTARPRAPPAA